MGYANTFQILCWSCALAEDFSHLRVWDTRKTENESCLNLMIHATWQQEVSWLWKPTDGVELLVVSSPGVNEALWHEALVWRFVCTEVNPDVCWNVHERTTLVVDGLFDWKTNDKRVSSAMYTNPNSSIFLPLDCISIAASFQRSIDNRVLLACLTIPTGLTDMKEKLQNYCQHGLVRCLVANMANVYAIPSVWYNSSI